MLFGALDFLNPLALTGKTAMQVVVNYLGAEAMAVIERDASAPVLRVVPTIRLTTILWWPQRWLLAWLRL